MKICPLLAVEFTAQKQTYLTCTASPDSILVLLAIFIKGLKFAHLSVLLV